MGGGWSLAAAQLRLQAGTHRRQFNPARHKLTHRLLVATLMLGPINIPTPPRSFCQGRGGLLPEHSKTLRIQISIFLQADFGPFHN